MLRQLHALIIIRRHNGSSAHALVALETALIWNKRILARRLFVVLAAASLVLGGASKLVADIVADIVDLGLKIPLRLGGNQNWTIWDGSCSTATGTAGALKQLDQA